MTIIEIETFLEIVRQETISGAAKALYISQPTITRRIQHMEEELGYPLFRRQKGKRSVSLTDEGKAFLRIAGQWHQLLYETQAISETARREILSIGSMYSVSRGLLADVLPALLQDGYRLRLYNVFSESAYEDMDRGIFELAFVSQQNYFSPIPPGVQQLPAFSETYLLACAAELPGNPPAVDLRTLPPQHELHVPWDISYMQWRTGSGTPPFAPQVVLEDLTLFPAFFRGESWFVAPCTLARKLQQEGAHLYRLQNPPPHRLTYYLVRHGVKEEAIHALLTALDREIRSLPAEEVQSLLRPEGTDKPAMPQS